MTSAKPAAATAAPTDIGTSATPHHEGGVRTVRERGPDRVEPLPDQRRKSGEVRRTGQQKRRDDVDLVEPTGRRGIRGEHNIVAVGDGAAASRNAYAPRHLLLPGIDQRRAARGLHAPALDAKGDQRGAQHNGRGTDQSWLSTTPSRRGPQAPSGAIAPHTQHNADCRKMSDERRPAVAHQWEGHARQRESTHVTPDRHGDLDAQEDRQPACDEGAVPGPGRPARDGQPPHKHDRGDHDDSPGEEPELLDEAGRREVGVASRQVLLHKLGQWLSHPPRRLPDASAIWA